MKQMTLRSDDGIAHQPPSGGCVLKLRMDLFGVAGIDHAAAAFGRLCVETPPLPLMPDV